MTGPGLYHDMTTMPEEISKNIGNSKTFGVGLHLDVPAAVYHSDLCDEPSLSSSIAKLLLAKTPAHARVAHPRLNPEFKGASTLAMNLGSVAHEILLGKGGGFEISPFDDYRTKDARAWRDDVIMRGKIPIKNDDLDAAVAMSKAIRAGLAEIPGLERAMIDGHAETVAIWRDSLGPLCRARPDWIDLDRGVIYDPKTTGTGLGDRSLNAKIAGEDTALDMRAAFYLRGIEQLVPELVGRIVYRWIFVETEAPFEVRVFEMDTLTREHGDRKTRTAIAIWQKCLAENRWPGYLRRVEWPVCPDWAMEDMYV